MFYIRRFFFIIKRKTNGLIYKMYKPARNVCSDRSIIRSCCESKALAHAICEIESADWKVKKQWALENKSKWNLSERVYMTRSDDCMSWHLWKSYDDQARLFCKVIPSSIFSPSIYSAMREKCIERLIRDQPWVCI